MDTEGKNTQNNRERYLYRSSLLNKNTRELVKRLLMGGENKLARLDFASLANLNGRRRRQELGTAIERVCSGFTRLATATRTARPAARRASRTLAVPWPHCQSPHCQRCLATTAQGQLFESLAATGRDQHYENSRTRLIIAALTVLHLLLLARCRCHGVRATYRRLGGIQLECSSLPSCWSRIAPARWAWAHIQPIPIQRPESRAGALVQAQPFERL